MSLSTSSKGNETTEKSSNISSGSKQIVRWKPVPLDGGYGWIVVFCSFLIHVFIYGFNYSFGVVGQSIVDEFEVTNKQVFLIHSLLTGLMHAFAPIAGVICDRLGCRATTIIGAVIAVTGCAGSFFATELYHLVITVGIVMGIGFGTMYCPALVIVTKYFEKKRSFATGLMVCGSGVGTLVVSRLMAFLIKTVARDEIRVFFPIYAGVLLLCVPCALLFKPVPLEPVYEEKKKKEEDSHPSGCWGKTKSCCRNTIKKFGLSLLVDPVYILYAISSALATAAQNSVSSFMSMNAEKVLHQPKTVAAWNVASFGIAQVFGRIFFGWISDKQFPSRCGKNLKVNRLCIYTTSLLLSGIGACFVFLYSNAVVYIIFCAVLGIVISSKAVLRSVVLVDFIGVDRLTNGLGLLLLFHAVACVAGPMIGADFFDRTGRYDWTFAFLGGCLVVGGCMLPITYLVQRMRHKEDDKQSLSEKSLTSDAEVHSKEQNI